MKRFPFVPAFLLCAALYCGAQQATTPPPAAAPAQKPDKFVACTEDADASGMTGCERMLLANITLRAAPIAQALEPIQREYQATVAALERAHPGFRYEGPSQQYPNGRLVKVEGNPNVMPAAAKPHSR